MKPKVDATAKFHKDYKTGSLIGRGNTAEVFAVGGRACKLFFPGYPRDAVLRELRNAELMAAAGLPVPGVFGMVGRDACYGHDACEGRDARDGIMYERLDGRSLFDAMLGGMGLDAATDGFCALQGRILGCRGDEAECYKSSLRWWLRDDAEALSCIDRLPDGDALCHGDFHPGNVLVCGDKMLAIDFMNVCRAPREYDIARTYVLISETPPDEDMPYYTEITQLQSLFAQMYLSKMGAELPALAPYIDVIRLCRAHEMRRDNSL